MECVEGALKTCFRKEMGVKLSPQIRFDENGCLNPQNVVSCDDFFVDQLLDLSNEEEFVEQEAVEEEEEEEDDDKGSASISVSGLKLHQNASFSAADDFSSLPTSELCVPADDLEDLEWLSHFVEDSFSEFSTSFRSAISLPAPKEVAGAQPEDDGSVSPHPQPCFKTPVPVKARSKRTRTGGRVWCLRSPSFTESSSSSTTSSSSSSPPSSWLIHPALDQYEQLFSPEIPPAKKPKKKFTTERARNCGAQPPRRCSHCGVQKTPQWRTGPLGAKTLCNACGVRYKSGRLLPEYRPACSPTFSSELHSNHHRKVLEMRRKKEAPPGVSDSGLAPPAVTSF